MCFEERSAEDNSPERWELSEMSWIQLQGEKSLLIWEEDENQE